MYSVEVEGKGPYLFEARAKDYKFTIDLKGKGITPPDTLLASLGSCIGVYIQKYFEGSKLAIGNFSIKLEAEFTKTSPVFFKDIKVYVDLKGARLDERRKKSLPEFIKNCPVHNTLRNNPNVEIKVL